MNGTPPPPPPPAARVTFLFPKPPAIQANALAGQLEEAEDDYNDEPHPAVLRWAAEQRAKRDGHVALRRLASDLL